MSFVSSLPANLAKYGLLSNWDFAEGHERYMRIVYTPDYAVGADRDVQTLPSVDFVVGLETGVALLPQLDRTLASERLYRIATAYDLSATIEEFFIRSLDTDGSRGEELSSALLAPKYFDLLTGKITTTPTSQSVYIGIGGNSGCVVVAGVKLCYKKLGDILDWETLENLHTAFKRIDDKVKMLIAIIRLGNA